MMISRTNVKGLMIFKGRVIDKKIILKKEKRIGNFENYEKLELPWQA